MKTYKFIYLDRLYNELQRKDVECANLQQAVQMRDKQLKATELTGLYQIRIVPQYPI
jgi:hypothetical protein